MRKKNKHEVKSHSVKGDAQSCDAAQFRGSESNQHRSRVVLSTKYYHFIVLYVLISVVSALEPAPEIPRFTSIDKCRANVIALNGTTPALDNLPWTLNLSQCLEFCGQGYGRYPVWVVISALTDWVFPLFFLLGNITYSKSASLKFYIFGISLGGQLNWLAVICHLLVNPVDFIWSLALKLELGVQIKERGDEIAKDLGLSKIETKDLCAVTYVLSDFQGGIWVDALLCPVERIDRRTGRRNHHRSRQIHWDSIKLSLETTARDLAHARRHNKLHSILAIIMYGKDVFVALIQSKYDKAFPYHMPHTLALRQLYYWLFLSIIISGAAGGFENQWTSQSLLEDFLEKRRVFLKATELQNRSRSKTTGRTIPFSWADIVLKPIEPWDGGNYSWMQPKGPMSPRKIALLGLSFLGVGLPFSFAFYMSWSTPTVGLGDRGLLELAYMGMWTLHFVISVCVGKLWEIKGWDSWMLFRMYWWNICLATGSLYVLFGAFQGWFNNCPSWSAYFSQGAEKAVLDLNMRDVVEAHIFTFYLPMVAVALVIQLLLAGAVIWMTKATTEFTAWTDDESRACYEGTRGEKVLNV